LRKETISVSFRHECPGVNGDIFHRERNGELFAIKSIAVTGKLFSSLEIGLGTRETVYLAFYLPLLEDAGDSDAGSPSVRSSAVRAKLTRH